MKVLPTFAVAACLVLATIAAAAGSPESEIKALDQAEARAVLARDRAALEKLFAEDVVVTNPFGNLLGRDEVLSRLTVGEVEYKSFTTETEMVRFLGDVAVSAGKETVVPAQGPQTGQTVHRRFTHVWKRDKAGWRLSVRHASAIPAK